MTTLLYNFVRAAAQAARRAEALRVAQADGGIFAGPADRTKTEAMLEAGRPAAAAAASRAVAPSTKRPRSVERVDGDSDEIDREDSPAKRTRRPFRQCPGNVNDADWSAQLVRLVAYKVAHGDCNVPRSWPEDPQLATWVRNQKKRKKGMPEERAAKLRSLGFF